MIKIPIELLRKKILSNLNFLFKNFMMTLLEKIFNQELEVFY